MESKSDALQNTMDYINVDLGSEGQTLLNLHSDGAAELISKDTVNFLSEKSCSVTYSPPYTPEKNGLAERSNRIIWESAYTMWLASCLAAMFWVYAVRYALLCANMLPTETEKGWMSPFQAKYGETPDVSRYRIFGCIAYVNFPAQLRDSTFAEKAYKGYFLGFTWPLMDRYLVFVPELDKVVQSAHVNFDEVTPVRRTKEEVLIVDNDRKTVADFAFLKHLVYVDDENETKYITTRVAISRGFIVAFRAPIFENKLGQEEPRPVHAKDVELLLTKYWCNHEPTFG